MAWTEEMVETLKKLWDDYHSDAATAKVSDVEYKVGDACATRDASGKALNVIAERFANLVGGSADLAPSNKSNIELFVGSLSKYSIALSIELFSSSIIAISIIIGLLFCKDIFIKCFYCIIYDTNETLP